MEFVVGHPRSGTQLVAHLLNAAAPCAAHELLAAITPEAVSAPTEFYAGRADAAAIARLLDGYDARPDPRVRIDCNWKLTWILEPLLRRWPEARVLHLTREPRANVRSCFNLDYYGELWRKPEYQTDDERNRWLRWMPEVRRDDWPRLSPFERNCAAWTESHRLALAATAGRPRTLRLRMEELPGPIFEFFGLPRPSEAAIAAVLQTRVNAKADEKAEIARLKTDILPEYPAWTVERRRALESICGEMARKLGY
jgi:hypothetical protein